MSSSPVLVLQLYHNPDDEQEWAQFLHSEEKFTDFTKVRAEIEADTDRETGSNKVCRLGSCLELPTISSLLPIPLPIRS